MNVVLYHGSPKKFDYFKIDPKLTRYNELDLAEGYGIYMSENKNIAGSYGEFLYEIQIDENSISDFTSRTYISNLIDVISKDVKIPIKKYINYSSIIRGVLEGDFSTTKFYKQITDWLDSNENFYNNYGNLVTYEEGCVLDRIEKSFFDNIKDVIRYWDKSFGENIYICFRNPEKLKIKLI